LSGFRFAGSAIIPAAEWSGEERTVPIEVSFVPSCTVNIYHWSVGSCTCPTEVVRRCMQCFLRVAFVNRLSRIFEELIDFFIRKKENPKDYFIVL
jgi:hypothetical protein